MNAQMGAAAVSRTRKVVGTVLTVLVVAMLFGSASAKFAHVSSVVSQLATVGIGGNRLIFVASLEALSALLFLIPATRSAGLLFVSAFLGGAIATHLQHGKSIASPAIVLGITWVGMWLRYPEILGRWNRSHCLADAHSWEK